MIETNNRSKFLGGGSYYLSESLFEWTLTGEQFFIEVFDLNGAIRLIDLLHRSSHQRSVSFSLRRWAAGRRLGSPTPLILVACWLVGCIFATSTHASGGRQTARRQLSFPRGSSGPRRLRRSPSPPYKVNVTSREDLRIEVDRILDKINSEGFGALTAQEKRLLDDAREALGRR